MIRNDEELAAAVVVVGSNLQAIQDYLGQDCPDAAKVRFPRGFIRTASHFRAQLGFLSDTLQRNVSYALMLSDVYRWVLNRTDIAGTAREMVIKEGICLIGSLCESVTKDVLRGEVSNKKGYKDRTKYLCDRHVIPPPLKEELDWVWETRRNEHLFLVTVREHQHYELKDYNRAMLAFLSMKECMARHAADIE